MMQFQSAILTLGRWVLNVARFGAMSTIVGLAVGGTVTFLEQNRAFSDALEPPAMLHFCLYVLTCVAIVSSLYTKSVRYEWLIAIAAVYVVERMTVLNPGIENVCHAASLVLLAIAAILFRSSDDIGKWVSKTSSAAGEQREKAETPPMQS